MKNKYWLKSGFFSFLQQFLVVLLGFGTFYILVRILDKNEFGAWSLFIAVTAFLEAARNGLVQNALVKFLASHQEEKKDIITASFAITGVLTLICILLNFGFANYLSLLWKTPQLLPMFYWYNIIFVFSGLITQFQCIQQANFRFDGLFYTSIARQLILFGYVLSSAIFGFSISLIALVFVQIVSSLVGAIIAYFFTRQYFALGWKVNFEWVSRLFHYGKYVLGTALSSILFNSIDQFMLGTYLSTAAAGTYNIAIRITNLVEIPTTSVSNIVFPQSARRVENEGLEAVKHLYEKSVAVILAILIPGLIFCFLFSGLIVDLVAGEKYEDTIPLLRVTLIYCLFIPYGRQFGTLLDSIGKTKLTFSIVVLSALINIASNYVFIHQYGVMGAAYGTLFANIIGFIIGQIILKRELNVEFLNTIIYAKDFYVEMFSKYLKPAMVRVRS
ncbi:flippase [Pedobacter sp. SYSU D00535]|uniref:flippase n=1 Tax=Pedobacter sp. SYSU D00535 TaxID=2810308 RepID=UPI001A962F81